VRKAASEGASLYYRFDAHWTARGHALAAAAVADFLRTTASPFAAEGLPDRPSETTSRPIS
jgi:hypothetical protein